MTATARTQAAEYYDHYWSESGYKPVGGVLHPKVANLCERWIAVGARCLEVGCGDGQTVGVWMAKRGYRYMGVDVSARAVSHARAAALDARVIEDAARLPFENASFDAAILVEAMEHMFLPHEAAAEILRILRPGGVLIVTVPNIAYWRRRLDLALFGRWNPVGDDLSVEQPWRDPHIRFFTCRSLLRMLRGAGFAQVRVGGHGGSLWREIPLVRNVHWRGQSFSAYRFIEAALPALFASRLHAVAFRP